jgi:hypothetical protein
MKPPAGFQQAIQLLQKHKKPVIAHNGLLDVFFTTQLFWLPLPGLLSFPPLSSYSGCNTDFLLALQSGWTRARPSSAIFSLGLIASERDAVAWLTGVFFCCVFS